MNICPTCHRPGKPIGVLLAELDAMPAGLGPREQARRLGMNVAAVRRALYRAGEIERGRLFAVVEDRVRDAGDS